LAATIRSAYPEADIELIGGGRGDFIVMLEDELLWNKKAMGNEYPVESAIVEAIADRVQ